MRIELMRQTLVSYQDYHVLVLTLAGLALGAVATLQQLTQTVAPVHAPLSAAGTKSYARTHTRTRACAKQAHAHARARTHGGRARTNLALKKEESGRGRPSRH